MQSTTQEPVRSRIQLQLVPRPGVDPGVSVPGSTGGLQVLNILLLVPGLFFALAGMGAYPPLNSRLPMAVLLGLFLIPATIQLVSFCRSGPNANPARWRPLLLIASCALFLLGAFVFLNGALDRSPVHAVQTQVLRKARIHVRRGTEYDLVVASWQPGKTVEHLYVAPALFQRVRPGNAVILELHDGRFGLPWRGHVLAP